MCDTCIKLQLLQMPNKCLAVFLTKCNNANIEDTVKLVLHVFCSHEAINSHHIQMPLHYLGIVTIDPRLTRTPGSHLIRMLEIMAVMGSPIGISNNRRYSCILSPCTASPLLIVFPHRRNVTQTNGGQRANINAHFHRCSTAQNINRVFTVLTHIDILEPYFVILGPAEELRLNLLMRQLGGMLLRIYCMD